MAAKKISELTELTTPSANDVLAIVDDADSTTKKIKYSNLGVGSGTVTSVSSADANATVATGTTTPVITIVSSPKLQTARTIGGTSFDGTANIVPATATAATTAANLSGTPTVPNGTAATTQSLNDSTTKLATTAFVQQEKVGYMLMAIGSTATPVDTTFYFIGAPVGVTSSGNPPDLYGMFRIYIGRAATIKSIYFIASNFGTLGSGETGSVTFYKNDNLVATIFTGVTTNSLGYQASSTGLSYAVSAGDYIYFQYQCPTWATNPTNLRFTVQCYLE